MSPTASTSSNRVKSPWHVRSRNQRLQDGLKQARKVLSKVLVGVQPSKHVPGNWGQQEWALIQVTGRLIHVKVLVCSKQASYMDWVHTVEEVLENLNDSLDRPSPTDLEIMARYMVKHHRPYLYRQHISQVRRAAINKRWQTPERAARNRRIMKQVLGGTSISQVARDLGKARSVIYQALKSTDPNWKGRLAEAKQGGAIQPISKNIPSTMGEIGEKKQRNICGKNNLYHSTTRNSALRERKSPVPNKLTDLGRVWDGERNKERVIVERKRRQWLEEEFG